MTRWWAKICLPKLNNKTGPCLWLQMCTVYIHVVALYEKRNRYFAMASTECRVAHHYFAYTFLEFLYFTLDQITYQRYSDPTPTQCHWFLLEILFFFCFFLLLMISWKKSHRTRAYMKFQTKRRIDLTLVGIRETAQRRRISCDLNLNSVYSPSLHSDQIKFHSKHFTYFSFGTVVETEALQATNSLHN